MDAIGGKSEGDIADAGVNKTESVPASSPGDKVLMALREEMASISAENDRLQRLCTSMHANHRQQSLRVSIF